MTTSEAMIYQLRNLKGKTLKQKLEYIITYFWLPILLIPAILISVVCYINHVVTMKDRVLNVICLNAFTEESNTEAYLTEFALEAGINLEEDEVYVSSNLLMNAQDLSTAYSTVQVLMTQIAGHSVDLLTGDLETVSRYFYQEIFWELDQVLSAKQQDKYKEYFLYADMALIRKLRDEPMEPIVFPDPTRPEVMEEPVAVAMRIPATSEFRATYYPYQEGDVVACLVAITENLENSLAFLDFIMEENA